MKINSSISMIKNILLLTIVVIMNASSIIIIIGTSAVAAVTSSATGIPTTAATATDQEHFPLLLRGSNRGKSNGNNINNDNNNATTTIRSTDKTTPSSMINLVPTNNKEQQQRHLAGNDNDLVNYLENPFSTVIVGSNNNNPNDDNNVVGQEANVDNVILKEEYTKVVSGPFLGPTFPLLNNLPNPMQQGIQQISLNNTNADADNNEIEKSDRIIGGTTATERFSHYASLLYWYQGYDINNQQQTGEWKWAGCGGTVISDCHILTAAHCVLNLYMPITGVFINALAPYDDNLGEPFHFSYLESYVVNPNYHDATNQGDIAIITLQTCVDSNKFPTAVPLQPYTASSSSGNNILLQDGSLTEIMGFGKLDGDGKTLPNQLQHAIVPYISKQTCYDNYYGAGILDDMICAGYRNGGIDACQGDSGSGLIYWNVAQQQYVHVGIVSWGIGCGDKGKPGVYVSVAYYYDWVHDNVCTNKDGKESKHTNIASWCNPNTIGYSNSNNNNNNNNSSPQSSPALPPSTQARGSQPTNGCGGGMPGDACMYGTDCCSGFCKASSLTSKTCTVSVTTGKQSFADQSGYGGAGGGASPQRRRYKGTR